MDKKQPKVTKITIIEIDGQKYWAKVIMNEAEWCAELEILRRVE